jgi:serine/threonine protein kinase
MAPEALIQRKFSEPSEVWAYGVLLYEIATCGQTPYAGLGLDAVARQLRAGSSCVWAVCHSLYGIPMVGCLAWLIQSLLTRASPDTTTYAPTSPVCRPLLLIGTSIHNLSRL